MQSARSLPNAECGMPVSAALRGVEWADRLRSLNRHHSGAARCRCLQYSPSALLLGFTAAGRPLHFQVSFADASSANIITIYEPDPNDWIDHRKRR